MSRRPTPLDERLIRLRCAECSNLVATVTDHEVAAGAVAIYRYSVDRTGAGYRTTGAGKAVPLDQLDDTEATTAKVRPTCRRHGPQVLPPLAAEVEFARSSGHCRDIRCQR